MRKVLLGALLAVLCVSAAFGGATEEWLEVLQDEDTTPQDVLNFINSGADVNARNDYGRTVLMLAVAVNSNP